MTLAVLVSTSRVAAEATVARLQALGIEAMVLDQPNVFVRVTSGGNYRVRVAVPEEELERARAELARWEVEARPRLEVLGREVSRGLLLATAPTVVLLAVLFLRRPVPAWGPAAVIGLFVGSLVAWVVWSRLRARSDAPPPAPRSDDARSGPPPGG